MNNRTNIMYFLGIGGIGMSALARWYKYQGATIYGYDLFNSALTKELINEGMIIHFDEDINKIPNNIDIVVYTPAIPSTNKEFIYLKNKGIPIIKRAALIGEITKQNNTIAIAGTHGKTSITALTAHILKNAGINVSAFVGGICKNYNTNLILSKSTDYLIVEADEYDRSLLKIEPNIAVISSMDDDHLDIYSDHNDIENTFVKFAENIPPNGLLIYNRTLNSFNKIAANSLSYGLVKDADIYASNIKIKNARFIFDIITSTNKIKDVEIKVPGEHNIKNTLAAVAIALKIGVSDEEIKKGISSFEGVERRMEFKINTEKHIFIDDYAHHPEEIKATIEAIKKLYPNKKLTGIFQPHLYSRTRDFADQFAKELSKLDKIILMDIYPAREKPIAGITSEIILKQIKKKEVKIYNKKEILNYLNNNEPELLLTMGAGDISLLVQDIKTQMT